MKNKSANYYLLSFSCFVFLERVKFRLKVYFVSRKQERARKKEVREKIRADKDLRSNLRDKLTYKYKDKLNVEPEFFFCPDMSYFVSNYSCIFRVFGKLNNYGFFHGGACDKCKRMDKYIPTIEEMLNGGEETRKYKTRKRGKD